MTASFSEQGVAGVQAVPDPAGAAHPRRLVAIGASAGGLEALSAVLGSMQADFGMPILVVQHLAPDHRSHLVELLAGRTPLLVERAETGLEPLPGHVYVAPPDHHMAIERGRPGFPPGTVVTVER